MDQDVDSAVSRTGTDYAWTPYIHMLHMGSKDVAPVPKYIFRFDSE